MYKRNQNCCIEAFNVFLDKLENVDFCLSPTQNTYPINISHRILPENIRNFLKNLHELFQKFYLKTILFLVKKIFLEVIEFMLLFISCVDKLFLIFLQS